MDWSAFDDWMNAANILTVAMAAFGAMALAAALGTIIRQRRERRKAQALESENPFENQEGYVVSAVLGLLALLVAFTFSLVIDRLEVRRVLVLEEANAIGTAYLRAQLLDEPHRTRMSDLLTRYTDNRIALAKVKPGQGASLLATNDALITDIWAATTTAFDSIKGLDFSSAYLDSVNKVIDLDSARKAARRAHVPAEVFALLFAYLVTTACVLGYVLRGSRGRLSAGVLLVLFTLALVLIIDMDRPTRGGITEEQQPMEELRKNWAARPQAVLGRRSSIQ